VKTGDPAAVVGYPYYPDGRHDVYAMAELSGSRNLGHKHVSPGYCSALTADAIYHDCSTIGGNSGSPLVDLERGTVVGVHCGAAPQGNVNQAVRLCAVYAQLKALGLQLP
jgi:endonuclease G